MDELIVADVLAALAAGRVAKRKPGFLASDGAQVRTRGESPRRICWTECETRAYVLRRKRTPELGAVVVVLTVLRAAAERAA